MACVFISKYTREVYIYIFFILQLWREKKRKMRFLFRIQVYLTSGCSMLFDAQYRIARQQNLFQFLESNCLQCQDCFFLFLRIFISIYVVGEFRESKREFIIRLYNKVHDYNSRQVNKYSKKNHHEKSRLRSGCNPSTIASIEHTIVNLTIIRIERRNDILIFFGFVPIRRRSKLLAYSFSSRFPMRLLNRKNTSKTC